MIYSTYYDSPLGKIILQSTATALIKLDFFDGQTIQYPAAPVPSILRQCIKELNEYFAKKRMAFSVPLSQEGTVFQLSVWNALKTIPYGTVKSYFDIATQIGNPKAVRAVGMTNGKNPIGIIVPCHRVIGKNGKMVGYASGIWRKEWLLDHERKTLSKRHGILTV